MTQTGLLYFLWVIVGIRAAWQLVDPRSAWRYSPHSKREPSDRDYLLQRVTGALILVATVIGLVFISQREAERDTPDADAEYRECLERARAEDEAAGGLGVVPPDSPCWDIIPEGEG